MNYHYIKFHFSSGQQTRSTKNRKVTDFFISILTKVFPKANPDFDSLIDNVNEWLVEVKAENQVPNREIGIDKNGDVILIMPWDPNYGYWTDNNLLYEDFKRIFNAVDITQQEFNQKWNDYVLRQPHSNTYEFDRRGFSKYWRFLEDSQWKFDGSMGFTKDDFEILFDTSEFFYVYEKGKLIGEFGCKDLQTFKATIKKHAKQ